MTSSEIGLYLLAEKYSSSNYIFGYTYNFDKTHQLIDKTLSDLVISCHLIIKFYDSNAMKQFINILEKAKQLVKDILRVPQGYSVLFLHGGGSLQFLMVPYNLLIIKGISNDPLTLIISYVYCKFSKVSIFHSVVSYL